MMVASQHFHLRKRVYIYIPHRNHTFRFIVFIGLVYNGIFVPRADVGMLPLDLMNYQCGILLAILILYVFSVAKKNIFTLKSGPFFARSCSQTIFDPFAVNDDGTRLRQ